MVIQRPWFASAVLAARGYAAIPLRSVLRLKQRTIPLLTVCLETQSPSPPIGTHNVVPTSNLSQSNPALTSFNSSTLPSAIPQHVSPSLTTYPSIPTPHSISISIPTTAVLMLMLLLLLLLLVGRNHHTASRNAPTITKKGDMDAQSEGPASPGCFLV